jgi:hypothetical protein
VDVDFFLPQQGMIVEFDESQHFTETRKITLSHYPSDLILGFSRDIWMKHCDETQAYDNDPPFRDEQRAWYDTLRDFLPEIKGFPPTIRLYARDIEWCTLDPKKSEDVKKFRNVLLTKSGHDLNQSTQLFTSQSPLPCWIATVTIRSEHEKDSTKNDERLKEIPMIIASILESRSTDGVILFPAGWVHTGKENAKTEEDAVSLAVTTALIQSFSDVLVCIGIDGRMDNQGFDHDQIALVIDKNGIKQRVRKFCASPQEKEAISNDLEPMIEAKASHILSFKNKKFFISVCYDVYANKSRPKGFELTNPGIDYVLNLVHRFPKSGEGSGVWYYVRDNFGGASRDWKCPVFGTGIFIKRDIADMWRSGVFWNLGNIPTNSSGITADEFSIPYETIPRIVFPPDFTDCYAEIRFFDHSGILQSLTKIPKIMPQRQQFTNARKKPSTSALQSNPSEKIIPFADAFDRKMVTIPGLKKREFSNKNNPKQFRYYFPDWEKKDNRPNYSIFYEMNDWNRYGKQEIRIDIQFWSKEFSEIGEIYRQKKNHIGEKMPLHPIIDWNITTSPGWSRLQYIFPDNSDPEIVAQSLQVLIQETKDIVNDWLISKKMGHY